jgi:hypothetical protein
LWGGQPHSWTNRRASVPVSPSSATSLRPNLSAICSRTLRSGTSGVSRCRTLCTGNCMSRRVALGAFLAADGFFFAVSSFFFFNFPPGRACPLPRSNAEVVGSTSYSTNEADFKNLSSPMYYPAAPQSVRFRSALFDQGKRKIADRVKVKALHEANSRPHRAGRPRLR